MQNIYQPFCLNVSFTLPVRSLPDIHLEATNRHQSWSPWPQVQHQVLCASITCTSKAGHSRETTLGWGTLHNAGFVGPLQCWSEDHRETAWNNIVCCFCSWSGRQIRNSSNITTFPPLTMLGEKLLCWDIHDQTESDQIMSPLESIINPDKVLLSESIISAVRVWFMFRYVMK